MRRAYDRAKQSASNYHSRGLRLSVEPYTFLEYDLDDQTMWSWVNPGKVISRYRMTPKLLSR